MQDPSAFQPMRPPQFPEQERLKCPRCESTNTKFCYYNNYNLSQPRHFCKHCRRYWTKGGSLRNIPVGGGTRKNAAKRPASSSSSPSGDSNPKRPELVSEPETQGQVSGHDSMTSPPLPTAAPAPAPSQTSPSTSGVEPTRSYFPNLTGGSFSSLLASNMQFGSILEGINSSGSETSKMVQLGGFGAVENLNSDPNMDRGPPEPNNGGSESESYLSLQNGGENSSCWGSGGSNWPDLAIYTPSSRFQ